MSGRRSLYILVAGVLFVTAACGGDDDPTTTAPLATTSILATVTSTLLPVDPGTGAGKERSGELLGR